MKTKIVCIYLCMILLIPVISVIAAANQPPTAPDISGPSSGNAGATLTYTFTSTDPDNDDLTYCIEWGCGENICTDPYPSAEPATASHKYAAGDYTIRAYASDGQADSDWSEKDITIPRNRPVTYMLFQRILQQFPNAFTLLRYIFGL